MRRRIVQGGSLTTRYRLSRLGILMMALALPAALEARAAAPPIPPVTIPAPAPPSGLDYSDEPNDAGTLLHLKWKPSPDDSGAASRVAGYLLERALAPGGPWSLVDTVASGTTQHADGGVHRDPPYFYRGAAFGPGGTTLALAPPGPAIARESWFSVTRRCLLVTMIGFCTLVLVYMSMAQSGKKPFVRRLAGIDAIEEAIARATEMGRPVLYVPGIQDID